MISEWNGLNANATGRKEFVKRLILASGSPRRQELLAMLGIPFEVIISDAEEIITHTSPAKVTEELSRCKAEAVAHQVTDAIVIGADTVVSVDDRILGKPKDKEEAGEMIASLQGRSHMVYTGVTILEVDAEGGICGHTFLEETRVFVASMNEKEIAEYIASSEPYDKAGAYGIQGSFGKFVERIDGDYYNVVGLPVHHLYTELNKINMGLGNHSLSKV